MIFDYKDRLVLVTGASSGLGRDLAKSYRARGARLALVARRAEALAALAKELDPSGKDARAFSADLSRPAAIPELVERIETAFAGPVEVAVHCAGASCYGEAELTPFDEIERITNLNYLAGVRLVQSVLPGMKKARSGQIVWIGSGSEYRGFPKAGAYCASKAAARCFCESVRNEAHSFGIDVILIVPGALKTGFHGSQPVYASDGRLRPIGAPSETGPMAERIVKDGMRRRPHRIYGQNARIGRHLAYWFPSLLDWVLRRQ